ncbi:MAG: hypothetical protein M3R66_04395 [Actinomycetota bacterium]|nr:hypothetical protein [Actinomycetota bacterium]
MRSGLERMLRAVRADLVRDDHLEVSGTTTSRSTSCEDTLRDLHESLPRLGAPHFPARPRALGPVDNVLYQLLTPTPDLVQVPE